MSRPENHLGYAMTLTGFANNSTNAYVLRTSDGGASWHPQVITAGAIHDDALLMSGLSWTRSAEFTMPVS